MELGLTTFGELTPDAGGATVSAGRRLRDLVEEAVLADQVGLDVYAVGEHHRPDFSASAPAAVLAAIAARELVVDLRSGSYTALARVPGAVTVIAALIGASLLGVVGALLAIPTAAAVLRLVREVFVRKQDAH